MKIINLYLPEAYIQALDELVRERYYSSRSAAIRSAVRDLLAIEHWGRNLNEKRKR